MIDAVKQNYWEKLGGQPETIADWKNFARFAFLQKFSPEFWIKT